MTKLERHIIGDQIGANDLKPIALFEAELESEIGSRLSNVSATSIKETPRRPKSDKGV